MRNLIIFLLLLAGISFQGCDEVRPDMVVKNLAKKLKAESGYKKVSVGKRFVVQVPGYMKQAENLNPDAILQYRNIFKETYFVLIEETKKEFIRVFDELNEYDHSLTAAENYRNIQLQIMSENIDLKIKSAPEVSTINGLNAAVTEVAGKFEDVNISYLIGFIEGPESIYMLMTWTSRERMKKYKPTFEYIIHSFELIEPA